MSSSWLERVEQYLDELEQVTRQIDETLRATRLETTELNTEEVGLANAALMERLADLETKIAQREELLRADDAPRKGITLTETLRFADGAEPAGTVERCREISERISLVHQRAVSLFVCQYHLSQLSEDIVRLIAGQTAPATYRPPKSGEKRSDLGGGLFDEAA